MAAAFSLAAIAFAAAPASAFDYFDGRLQVHGYFGQQVRALGRDLDPGDGIELAQWYNVLGLEIEGNLAPDGVGPIEILEAFVRLEARYDCVWSGACGLAPQRVNTYGNGAGHFPKRVVDGRLAGYSGALRNGDERRFAALGRGNFSLAFRDEEQSNLRRPLRFSSLPGLVSLFGNSDGPNEQFEPLLGNVGDDPAPFLFSRILNDCRFGVKRLRGGEDGMVTAILGPWNPSCKVRATGALRGAPNPWSFRDFNPILAGVDRTPGTADDPINPNVDPQASGIVVPVGRGALPFRPAPLGGRFEGAPAWVAQGLEYPSAGMARELRRGDLDSIQQNFSETELAWNRGASQQDEGELKEAYIDLEAAAGRLWMRLGKQTIVWGKTELFRNTDQFNPQDLALASLPGLEESRIGLWAVRGSWSFYNIGKLEDVRLEVAVNFDDFEPADLGRCGEPFSIDLVCNLTFGYFAHGLLGAGLVGTDRPDDPWESVEGLEVGARVEWRYRRFSFQLSNFNGFDDFPYPDQVFVYSRNVDPETGRPRRGTSGGDCKTGDSRVERACLGRGDDTVALDETGPLRVRDWNRDGIPDDVTGDGVPDILRRNDPNPVIAQYFKTGELIPSEEFQRDVVAHHHANQSAFATSNAATVGAAGSDTDPALAGFGSFNGKEGPVPRVSTMANGASGLLAGSPRAFLSARANNFIPNVETLNLIRLHLQTDDDVGLFSDGGGSLWANVDQALGQFLTPQQEALLGCGPFWSSDCDDDGIDLLNAEGSVLIQSWPGFDGTRGSVDDWRVDQGLQPGTVDFAIEVGGGPVATRWVDGQLVHLPGSRGFVDERGRPDPAYLPLVDGCTQATGDPLCAGANVVHPLTGQAFRTELSAVSWNLLMVVASRSDPRDPANPTLSEFTANDADGDLFIDPTRPDGTPWPGAGTVQLRPGVGPDVVPVLGTPVACGLLKPHLCENVRGLLSGVGAGRKDVRAGGNGAFGRRDLAWHSSGELVLRYERRNVLGFAFDVAEDRTKTNWGVEATWVTDQTFVDNDRRDGLSKSDTWNLTVSVDRPTFINFLNPNRTILFNSQWFFQYIQDYEDGFTSNGPLNALATLTAFTGYHQDRLIVVYTGVYDFRSSSGAVLPQVTYRFSENFSASVGANFFFGRQQMVDSPITELRAGLNRTGRNAYEDAVENGLTALRDRDEVYMTLRYSF